MALLNTATSIVDFLKSQNKPSDFTSRQSLYESSGLKDAFGDYRGTAEQNVALLNRLKPAASTTSNLGGSTPGLSATEVIAGTTPSNNTSGTDMLLESYNKQLEADRAAAQQEQGALSLDLAANAARESEGLQRNVAALKGTAEQNVASLATQGEKLKTRAAESAAGFGGAFSGATKKTQAEIAQEVAQKQTQVRNKLGDQLYNAFSDFEKNYGTKFLESLSIPEAQQFVQLPAPVRGIVMKNYQDAVAKAEEKASKGALDTLEKLGYTVINGQIAQTLQGQSESRLQKAAELKQEKPTIREYVVGGRRIRDLIDPTTGQVISSMDLGDAGESGSGGTGDQKAVAYDNISRSAFIDLESSKGKVDHYYNPDTFMSYRNQVAAKVPSKLSDFDKQFGLNLNPADAIRLGINQATIKKNDTLSEIKAQISQ